MAIKPIDMQVLLPKLHKHELLKPRILHKVENEQQVKQNSAQQDIDEKLKRVNTFDRKDANKIRNDKEESRQQQQSGQKEKEEKESKEEAETKSAAKEKDKKYRHIDLKV